MIYTFVFEAAGEGRRVALLEFAGDEEAVMAVRELNGAGIGPWRVTAVMRGGEDLYRLGPDGDETAALDDAWDRAWDARREGWRDCR